MRHLPTGGSCPVVSGQGCVIMTSFGPSLGGLPSLRKLCLVLLCNFEEKPAVLCTYIISISIIQC